MCAGATATAVDCTANRRQFEVRKSGLLSMIASCWIARNGGLWMVCFGLNVWRVDFVSNDVKTWLPISRQDVSD